MNGANYKHRNLFDLGYIYYILSANLYQLNNRKLMISQYNMKFNNFY